MQTIKCELCGAAKLIKKDGIFACMQCGTQYAPDEARKLLTDALKTDGFLIKDDTLIKYNGDSADVTIPDIVNKIAEHAFQNLKIEKVTIPDSITKIADYAFSGCTELTDITIPDSVINIGRHAFEGCEALTNISLPEHVRCIDLYAFSGCTNLTEITIPESVTIIKRFAFSECTALTSIIIPNSITIIESSAFENCTALDPEQIQTPVFNGNVFDTVFLEKGYCTCCAGKLTDGDSELKCTRCGKTFPKESAETPQETAAQQENN